MSILAKIAQRIAGFDFSSPRQSDILIFDGVRSEVLENLVLPGLDYQILHARCERTHVHYKIVLALISGLGRFNFRKLKTSVGAKQEVLLH